MKENDSVQRAGDSGRNVADCTSGASRIESSSRRSARHFRGRVGLPVSAQERTRLSSLAREVRWAEQLVRVICNATPSDAAHMILSRTGAATIDDQWVTFRNGSTQELAARDRRPNACGTRLSGIAERMALADRIAAATERGLLPPMTLEADTMKSGACHVIEASSSAGSFVFAWRGLEIRLPEETISKGMANVLVAVRIRGAFRVRGETTPHLQNRLSRCLRDARTAPSPIHGSMSCLRIERVAKQVKLREGQPGKWEMIMNNEQESGTAGIGTIDVSLGCLELPIDDLVALQRGSVIHIDLADTLPVAFRVGATCVGTGELRVNEGQFSLHVTQMWRDFGETKQLSSGSFELQE